MKPSTKTTILRIIIPVMALLVISQTITGLSFIFGAGNRTFFQFHKIGGLTLLGLILFMHVPLNWDWVSSSYFKRKT